MNSYHVRWMDWINILDRDFDNMARYDIDWSFREEPYQAKTKQSTKGRIIRKEVQRKKPLGQTRTAWQPL